MAGGKIAIYIGLIEQTKTTDDEIAQVIGHEISHAPANPPAERMSMVMASQFGLMGLAVALGGNEFGGAVLPGSSAAATGAITLPNSRTSEVENGRNWWKWTYRFFIHAPISTSLNAQCISSNNLLQSFT